MSMLQCKADGRARVLWIRIFYFPSFRTVIRVRYCLQTVFVVVTFVYVNGI